ncbi:MAG: hypothetical protein GX235_05650 [Clostridiales bacterium]|nr:hypothetical protein [Clostridiales bacterium]
MYTIDNKIIGKPYPLGVTTECNHTYFSAVMKKGIDCGIILYDKETKKESRIPFDVRNKYGSVFCIGIEKLDIKRYEYNFYDGEYVFTDPYAKVIYGRREWGTCDDRIRGGFLAGEFDWEGDKTLKIPYENSIFYCLNVRAFTKHKSSGITHKGTYRGIIEKIPHLKELGITAVELMPAYEFDETERQSDLSRTATMMEELRNKFVKPADISEVEKKCNCWGYTEGYYFAPKSAFSSDIDAVTEFKDMVKELHKNGIEVIMQFYFPCTVNQGKILDAVKYWVLEYHIDGVHLKGERIPAYVIATDPHLTETKILYDSFPYDEIYRGEEVPEYRNLASYNDNYMYSVRRFLKGDDNMVGYFLELQRQNPARHGIVNYVTNYYGFTLSDMVSYERKHNEANGENNQDGIDCNFTWNCGMEGITRKKSILELRTRQIKNVLVMLFMSQGTPLIYSGDELGNTRYGNNNPYCQDNETGYVKWNMSPLGKTIFSYMKDLISLKKMHPLLRNKNEMKVLDYIGCGYPDVSYHGEEAWRPELSSYSRYVGVMYCGFYGKKDKKEDDNFFYIAYNMHWLPHVFALPKLPKGMKWCLLTDTGETGEDMRIKELAKDDEEQPRVEVKPRTVHIYISEQKKGQKTEKRQYSGTPF